MPVRVNTIRNRQMIPVGIASLFIIWHSIALVFVGPGPDSHLYRKLRPWYEPYLEFFHLDNAWGFYAPNPIHGTMLHYRVDFPDGNREFSLREKFQKLDPAYFRHTLVFKNLRWDSEETQRYRASFAQYLCRQHEGAMEVALIAYDQINFTPEDYLNGRHPLEPARLKRKILGKTIACQ